MNLNNSLALLTFAILNLFLTSCSKKEPLKTEKPSISKDIVLFNGTDLKDWIVVGGKGQYKIENNNIVGYGENMTYNTFLRTKKTYTDFELTFEFKFDNLEGNSGVMFRANQKPSEDSNGEVFGYQCEIDNKKRAWTAGIYDEARRGWLYPHKTSEEHSQLREKFTKQGNDSFHWEGWNTITVRCEGNHIKTWLNGKKRADFTDSDENNDTREGFIALQVHAGKSFKARWKNIILKEL